MHALMYSRRTAAKASKCESQPKFYMDSSVRSFFARRYPSAGYAAALCPCVSPSLIS